MIQKRKANPMGAIIGGVIVLIAAIVVAVLALQSPPALKNVSEIKAGEMNDKNSYYFEELIIIDHYLTRSGDDNGNGKYYLATFEGEDEKLYIVSLYAEDNKEMKNKLWTYASDPNLQIGDMIISGCFKSKSVEDVEGMADFYDTSATSAVNYLKENTNKDVKDLYLHLNYVCEKEADYEKEASQKSLLIVSAVFVILGGVMLFFGIKAKKKLKEEAEARARFNENQPSDPTPYQGPEF